MNQPSLLSTVNNQPDSLNITSFLCSIQNMHPEELGEFLDKMEITDLASRLTQLNDAFRSNGAELVSNEEYDHVWKPALVRRDPNHPILNAFEPESESAFAGAKKVKHTIPMLSTNKAYTNEEMTAYVHRVEKSAREIGIDPQDLIFKATAKIDGMAAVESPDGILASRGESKSGSGYDISRLFEFGLARSLRNDGKHAVGELAVNREYFNEFLSDEFVHERGVPVGLASAAAQGGQPSEAALQAVKDNAIRFIEYKDLDTWIGSSTNLLANIDQIYADLTQACAYLTDGIVIEIDNEKVKAHMGHNRDFHKWQIAKKVKGEMKEATILGIEWQVGRSGRCTPCIKISKTTIDGRTIERPTGHNARHIIKKGFGVGAKVLVHFAGGVIPAIEKALVPVEPEIKATCNCCGSDLEWVEPSSKHEEPIFLHCPNVIGCSAQAENRIAHFFHIHGEVNGFGCKTVQKLVQAGVTDLATIYRMDKNDYINAGISSGVAENLVSEIERSLKTKIKAENFLSGLGLKYLGRGQARRLLEKYTLETLENITAEGLIEIEGFGEKKAPSIAASLQNNMTTIKDLLSFGFNLEMPMLKSEHEKIESPIKGMGIVFTGTLASSSRKELQDKAVSLGATAQKTVTKNTSILVCGSKVGERKTTDARQKGVMVISEDQYIQLLNGDVDFE